MDYTMLAHILDRYGQAMSREEFHRLVDENWGKREEEMFKAKEKGDKCL